MYSSPSKDRRGRRARLVCLPTLVLLAISASGTTLLTRDEALALAFPGAAVERITTVLSDAQQARASELCGQALDSAMVIEYKALRDGAWIGSAYLDSHRVRTLPETLMVVVGPDGLVMRVEVLAFREPREYLPPKRWLDRFTGRVLDEELQMKRGVPTLAGATLSARAATTAVRRLLAIHQVMHEAAP